MMKLWKVVPVVGVMALGMILPNVASAQALATNPGPVWVSVNDDSANLVASINAPGGVGGVAGGYAAEGNPVNITGVAGATGPITNEIPGSIALGGSLGSFDAHFEYLSNTAPAPGNTVSVNFNIYGAEDSMGADSTTPSDTVNVVFTGHTPGAGDLNNVSVDMHFRSDNENGIALPALTGGTALFTLTEPSAPGLPIDLTSLIQSVTGVPQDFHLRVSSWSVPEIDPGSAASVLACLVSGSVLLKGRRRKAIGA